MSSVTSSTATKSPNFFVMRSTLTKGLALGSVQGSNLSCLSRGEVAMRLRAFCFCLYGPERLAWSPAGLDPSLNRPAFGAAGFFRTAPCKALASAHLPVVKRVHVRLRRRVYSSVSDRSGNSLALTSGGG